MVSLGLISLILLSLFQLSSSQLPNIAIVTDDSTSYVGDVIKNLSPSFNVTFLNANGGITLALLQQYSLVFAWTNHGWNGNLLGTLFTQYVSSGSPLVLAIFSFQNNTYDVLTGGFFPNYYAILPGTCSYGPRAVLGSFDSSHPIMAGVKTFDGGVDSWRVPNNPNPNAKMVALWSDGQALVATLEINGVKRVDLGFFPPSNAIEPAGWVSTTDGAKIMVNAINYALSSDCGTQTDCLSCTKKSCQWCLDTNQCSRFDDTCQNRVNNPNYCPITCGGFPTCNSCLDPPNNTTCSWCFDNNSCVSGSQNDCQNDINNPIYCKSKIDFN